MDTPPLPDDRELSVVIRRASGGSTRDIAILVERFTPPLLIQAEHRVGAPLRRFVDPADVVSDVWLIALRRLSAFAPEPGRSARTCLSYLSTILLRHVRDLYEKHLGGKPATARLSDGGDSSLGLLPLLPDDTTGIVSRAVRAERAAALRQAIASLDPTDRAIVVLRGIESLSNETVAKHTGLAPNTVSVRLRRALELLRGVLPPQFAEDLGGM